MRNLKKLFAVIMAVAMLASVMVPALAAEGFKYEAEAKKLYDLGLFKGNSETSYEPDLGTALNRQAGLALAIRLMGKDAEVAAMTQEEIATQLAKIVDANEISDWAKPYAAYAVKNGLTNGIDPNILPNVKFGAQLDLTGKEFINFVLKAMGYQVAWDDVLTKAASIGMLSAGDAVTFGTTAVMTRDLAVGVMASALGGTTASGVTLAQALIDAGAVSAEAMAAAGFFTPTATPEPTPAVLEATASTTNNIQINVVYNEEVDKDSATKLDNYKLSKGDIEKAELQDDGVTVVLTLKYASAKNQEDKVDLTIKNVKSTSGIVIAETTLKDILFLDKDIPTVVDAQVVGKDTVKVIFSEPMKPASSTTSGDETTYFLSKDGFVVNGGKLYVKEAKLQKNYTEARVKLYSSLPEGEVSFQVKSTSEDFAGFGVIGKLFTLNVVKDTEAPVVVGYENAKPTEVTLIWNEDIEFDGFSKTEWYHTNGSNTVKDNGVTIDGNKTKLTFEDSKKLAPGTAYVYVLKEAVKDLWGNKNTQQMYQIEVVLDVTPPEVDKVEQGSNEQTIKVKYTEAMDSDSTKKASNYTILDKDGKEQKDLVKSVTLSSDGKEATLNLSKKIGGDYSLVVKGVKDLAGNEIVEVTVPFTVVDKTVPNPTDFTVTLHKGGQAGQMIKVAFGEAMAAEGKYAIDDIDKYVFVTANLGQDNETVKTLKSIKNVSLTIVDNGKAVEITIPSTADNATDGWNVLTSYTLRIARVADAAGNYTDALSFNKPIVAASTINVEKAEATARNTIEVTFADEVKFEINDFVVNKTVSGTVYKMNYAEVDTTLNDKGKTVATLKLTEDLPFGWGTGTELVNTSVSFVVYGEDGTQDKVATENKYGSKVTLGPTTVADKIAPELYDDGKDETDYAKNNTGVKDYLVFNKTADAFNYTFTLYFSENMKTALTTDYTGSDFVITVGDKTLANGKDYKVTSIVGNAVNFEFTTDFSAEKNSDGTPKGTHKVSGDFTIKLADKTNYITDIAGNAPKAFDAIEYDDLLINAARP